MFLQNGSSIYQRVTRQLICPDGNHLCKCSVCTYERKQQEMVTQLWQQNIHSCTGRTETEAGQCLNDLLETRFWFCRKVMTQNPLNACFSGIFRPRMHIVSFLCLISNVWMCVLCHVLGTARSANAGCFAQQSDPDRQGLSVAVVSLSCSVRPRLCSAHTVGTHESLVKPVDWFGAGESPPN